MKRNHLVALIANVLFVVGAMGAIIGTDITAAQGDEDTCWPGRKDIATIATAKLIIEYNSTDDDIGVHGAFDDHGWSQLRVYDPNGRPVLAVKPQTQLKALTMAGIFFESREPPATPSRS